LTTTDPLMTITEVAHHIGISATTWRGYVHRSRRNPGSNPAPQPFPGDADPITHRPRWRQSAVDAWVALRPSSRKPKETP
jgi:predicted DNA-binding transcriptional regulator AlpA